MRTIERFEYKYRVEKTQYHQIKNMIRSYMDLDAYTLKNEEKKYLVKSLYFDTHDYAAYTDKCYGDYSRIKCRIRSYHDMYHDDMPINIELKTRRGMNMKKYSIFITGKEYRTFMKTRHFSTENSPVLIEFERLLHLNHLQPKTVVRYKREGLVPKGRENFRVTFDHGVESVSSYDLFPQKPNFKGHDHHKGIVLEVKTLDVIPPWLQRIIRQYGLKAVANSKYGQSIELTRKDIVMPMSDHMISSFYSTGGRRR